MKPIFLQAVGADPEVFLVDKNGHPVSAEGKIGGSKDAPLAMEGLPDGFFIQEDNVAAEYNIPPAASAAEFSRNISRGLLYVRRAAAKHGLKVMVTAALNFDKFQLATPHAQRLGCEPDLDFWKLCYNPKPEPPESLRTAAGHVHISWGEPDDDQRVIVARLCDLFLGVPSILVTEPNARRQLYGKAGCVRVKPYGLEYRTLDNFWIDRAIYREHVFNSICDMIHRVKRENDFLIEELELCGQEIQDCINTHNKGLAEQLMNDFGVMGFPKPDEINLPVKRKKKAATPVNMLNLNPVVINENF